MQTLHFSNIFVIAPGSYEVEKAEKKVHGSSPAYSLGVKYKERKSEDLPGRISFVRNEKKIYGGP